MKAKEGLWKMSNRIRSAIQVGALAAGMALMGVATASAANAADVCGFDGAAQTWNNCTNSGDYVGWTWYDPGTMSSGASDRCIPAQAREYLMPGFTVDNAYLIGPC